MTIQERIDRNLIYETYKKDWREGTVEEFEADFPQFKDYISRINWGELNSRVAILKSLEVNKTYHLYLFSQRYIYSISVNPHYLGCILAARQQRPLEDWHRCSDLPDGDCTEDTFKSILYAILSCELVPFDDGTPAPSSVPES